MIINYRNITSIMLSPHYEIQTVILQDLKTNL